MSSPNVINSFEPDEPIGNLGSQFLWGLSIGANAENLGFRLVKQWIEGTEEPFEAPFTLLSKWRQTDNPGALIRIEFHILASQRKAEADFQTMKSLYSTPVFAVDGLGEQAYGPEVKSSVVFLRGNTVFLVANAGKVEEFDAVATARRLDALLVRPSGTAVPLTPATGRAIPLKLPLFAGEARVWYRLYSDSGRFYSKGETVFYVSTGDSPPQIVAFRHKTFPDFTPVPPSEILP